MKLICAGLSKTGTKSITKALRTLGYTVYDYREHRDFHINEWLDLYCEGKLPNFTSMYKNIDAVIGLPASFWYEEIFEAFPNSKVLLSVRDGGEEEWVKSWAKQNEQLENPGFLTKIALRWLSRAAHRKEWLFLDVIFTAAYGSLDSKSTVLFKKKYREHNARVKAVIPQEQLLIYSVKQGWKPLCEFLGFDVPEQEFPCENVGCSHGHQIIGSQFQEFKVNFLIVLSVLVFLVALLYFVYLNQTV